MELPIPNIPTIPSIPYTLHTPDLSRLSHGELSQLANLGVLLALGFVAIRLLLWVAIKINALMTKIAILVLIAAGVLVLAHPH